MRGQFTSRLVDILSLQLLLNDLQRKQDILFELVLQLMFGLPAQLLPGALAHAARVRFGWPDGRVGLCAGHPLSFSSRQGVLFVQQASNVFDLSLVFAFAVFRAFEISGCQLVPQTSALDVMTKGKQSSQVEALKPCCVMRLEIVVHGKQDKVSDI